MVMPALTPRATPVRADDTALLHVLNAYIETLKAENEILKRRLADAEARAKPRRRTGRSLSFRLSWNGSQRRRPIAPSGGGGGSSGRCHIKFYTACLRAGTRWSSTVFAHELSQRAASFEPENGLYSFAFDNAARPASWQRLIA
jgi:hypothetical protein